MSDSELQLDTLDEPQGDASRGVRLLVALGALILVGGLLALILQPWADDGDGAASSSTEIGMLDGSSPNPGDAAPDFALLDQDGNRHQLSDFRGQAVFLNFWADWCTFCKEEMPDMQEVHEQFGEEVVVIGVNAGDSIDVGERFVDSVGVTYLRLYDRELEVTDGYRVQAMPTSYFIDADGQIADFNFGFMVYDQMVEKVQTALDAS